MLSATTLLTLALTGGATSSAHAATHWIGGALDPNRAGERGLRPGDVTAVLRVADSGRRGSISLRFVLDCGDERSTSNTTVPVRIRDGQVRGKRTWRNASGFRLRSAVRAQIGGGVVRGTLRARGRGDGSGPCSARRAWQLRAVGSTAAIDPAAPELLGAVRGEGGAVLRRFGGQVRLLAGIAERCRGVDVSGMNISPPMTVAPDGTFRRRERFRLRFRRDDPLMRWTVVSAGRLDAAAGRASGTIRIEIRWRTGGRAVSCEMTRRWEAIG